MDDKDIDRIVARARDEAYTQGYIDGLEYARRMIAGTVSGVMAAREPVPPAYAGCEMARWMEPT